MAIQAVSPSLSPKMLSQDFCSILRIFYEFIVFNLHFPWITAFNLLLFSMIKGKTKCMSFTGKCFQLILSQLPQIQTKRETTNLRQSLKSNIYFILFNISIPLIENISKIGVLKQNFTFCLVGKVKVEPIFSIPIHLSFSPLSNDLLNIYYV